MSDPLACPLCASNRTPEFHTQADRVFHRCSECLLVFVPRRFHLPKAAERAVYDLHENDPNDPRYRKFLSRLFTPLRARILDSAMGLDFGSGPGPTLATMFRESGVACENYDPMFADDRELLARQYDFIASSEVFEHLADPAGVLRQLVSMLRPSGWLGVMTKRVTSPEAFARWHYIRDPTHVAFFSNATFAWIGERYGLSVHVESPDVVLLRAPAAHGQGTVAGHAPAVSRG